MYKLQLTPTHEQVLSTHLSKAVWPLPLLVFVAIVPLLLRVPLLVGGSLESAGLEGDVGPLGVEVGQGHEVNEDTHAVGVEEEFDVLFVVEKFVNEHEEPVPLCAVLTLHGSRENTHCTVEPLMEDTQNGTLRMGYSEWDT